MKWSRALLAASLLATSGLLGSCGAEEPIGPQYLSEWELFADGATQAPMPGVVPYDLNAALFSDYASKHRFFVLPEGERATVGADGHLDFPEGTIVVKTFGFYRDLRDPSLGERIIETRLLVREGGRWVPYVYVWNDDTSEAELVLAGRRVPVSFVDLAGETRSFDYRVPSRTQCGNCHGGTADVRLLGPRVEQLDRMVERDGAMVEQLAYLLGEGVFATMPAGPPAFPDPFDPSTGDLDSRARAYLDANCAGCHREDGAARQSGLWLGVEITDPVALGVCKPPAAAGRGTGGRGQVIHPGDPDDSVLVFRVESDEPGVKMPELPTLLVHTEGAALLREWIAAMPPRDCSGP